MADRGKIKAAIDDWLMWYRQASKALIKRTLSVNVSSELAGKKASAYIGVRRCGKTFSAIQASKDSGISADKILYFNFEDPLMLLEKGPAVFDEVISVHTEYAGISPELVLFDEVQNIEGWEKWVRKAVDMGRFRLHITGSSAKMLSSELSTAISGRNIEIPVWPLSFGEYLVFSNRSPNNGNEYLSAVRDYLNWGGFPEVALVKEEEEKRLILRQYVNDIMLKDIIGRHEIRSKHQLDRLMIYYFTNISSPHSYNSVSRVIQMNTDTVADYTGFLAEAFLFFEVKRYYHNLKVQMRDMKKIYCIDTGMRNVHSVSPFNDELGKLAENAVYIHLRRQGKEVWYFKGDAEADFVVTKLGKPQDVIQVCYSDIEDAKTREREVGGLIEALEYTGLKKGVILTSSREEKLSAHGKDIEFIPLYKWLKTVL